MAPKSPARPADGLDDLFDYSVDMQDVFRDVDVRMDFSNDQQAASLKSKDDSLRLGIDEEIKVVKKRQPVPKLDENRFTCLLNVYQLWLDDLYPRAKFADGLAIIEKLGHSKRIQIMRREWINEGKPQERLGDISTQPDGRQATKSGKELKKKSNGMDGSNNIEDSGLRRSSTPNDDDLYVASPPRQQHVTNQHSPRASISADINLDKVDENGVPEDDLDALLADTSTDIQKQLSIDAASPSRQKATLLNEEIDFDAEMEVMAEMDELW
ncbi:MAG: hypothetical protein Q9196_000657 [Gyalolechia fulgens]